MIAWLTDIFSQFISVLGTLGWWLAVISVAMFLLSIVAIRFIVLRIPADYFMRSKPTFNGSRHPLLSGLLYVVRNLAGFVLLVVGLIMSIPGVMGQGVLTILIALSLMDFPGKRALELKIIRQRIILNTINSVRAKAGKPALELPDENVPSA